MEHGRIISCFITKESDSYYDVQIIQVTNPCSPKDWQSNEDVKIRKSLIIKIEWNN